MTIGSQRAIRVLGFAGSLRRGSYNRALLRAARWRKSSVAHPVALARDLTLI